MAEPLLDPVFLLLAGAAILFPILVVAFVFVLRRVILRRNPDLE